MRLTIISRPGQDEKRPPARRGRLFGAAGAGLALMVAAGCSRAAAPVSVPAASATPLKAVQLRVAPAGPPRVSFSQAQTADGSKITIATFSGNVSYVLHNGSLDPGNLLAGKVQAGPKITASRPRLLAAFNGGFLMKSLSGGYEQEGHVARPLRAGLASLVIDKSGKARVGVWGNGVWGKGLPAAGESVYSVRQNLWLLVSGGQPTKESARWWRWGGTIGNQEYVARSALGQNAAGDLMYAGSMSTTPADLAAALAKAGAVNAMELDINPEWVQLDAASRPGGPLTAEIPGQHRPANQYLTGWTRDFIAVLAPPAG
ncbi:MAG TPA: hypothetical protein VFO01_12040 [Trebonia sp.]|nr:hypothetical protein [Trebonia sp.]